MKELLERLKREEGFRSEVYIDSEGFATIGYGNKLSNKKYPQTKEGEAQAREDFDNKFVTEEEASKELERYVQEQAVPDAISFVGVETFDKLSESQQEALISMSLNLGKSTLNKFQGVKKALQKGDFETAAYEALNSKAATQVPSRYFEIAKDLGPLPSKEKLSNIKNGRKFLDKLNQQKYKPEGSDIYSNKKQEEKEVPQVEEQSFLERVGDFFSDTFGISAEASEVPPMETLQQPQEEVPMSPTDAMRAQSQGRVVLDSMQSAPTNPEAGPSDTVPAMLTPGEAVIQAAAAQDPENIPVIEKMIDEGRAKNRMAEANGIPVNGKEAMMYDDAELDAYHKRNKTGKYGGGEQSLQGFAGGVMEVPSMMMMAPPKDPAMDQMEKLAVKQMGYEQKSKNRTRDTIEKIGLKHLEDTADANMKQAALDETMKNYGMEVPMPMQPVPQGFQDGTPSLQEALSYMEQGPQQDPRMELLEADAEGRGLSYLLGGGTPVSSPEFVPPLDLVDEEQVAQNVAANIGYDPRAAQQAEAELASFKVPQEFVPEKAVVDTPKVETTTPDLDDSDKGGFLSGLGKALGSAFKSAAKSVFDPESIATAGIYYGVNRLLGYNDATAAKQAAIGYSAGQQQRAAKLKLAADILEKRQTTQAQRDKEDIANQTKLRNAAESQFNKAFEQTLTKEGARAAYGTTPEALTGEVVAALRTQGVDMSDPLQVEYAMNLVPSVVQQYKESMQRGEEILSVQDAFDRVFRSKLEVSDALSVKDAEGVVTGVVKSGVTAPLFNQIRKNISNANTPEGQAEFESRLSLAFKLFQERKDELNLPAPSAGENEFTVFLRTVLGQGTIRDFAK